MSFVRTGKALGPPKMIALAVCISFGVAFLIANARSWQLEDAEAYWNAGLRLRHGLPLYIPVGPGGDEMIAYRYSPWIAWLWVPLTFLPKALVQAGWSILLVGSAIAAIAPLARQRTVAAICLAALLGGLLMRTASTGNVHALLVAALVHGIPRRSGPIWIGLAASVKIAPIAYALVYAGRREWGRAGLALAVTVLLFAPALLYDLRAYPIDPRDSFSLLSIAGLVPWAAGACVAVLVAFGLARTRHAWAAASLAVLALIPRLDLYGLTYLLVGLNAPTWRRGDPAPEALERRK
jgi:glycosyl transferase family 87